MSQSSTPAETAKGFAPPSVTQLSVFLANKVGRLLDLVRAFEDSPTRVCAISVHEASDHAVVRLITGDVVEARKVLERQELSFMETELLVVALDDQHTLAKMCQVLLGAELNIRFAYPLMLGLGFPAAIAVAVDDLTFAAQILRRKEFRLLAEADLAAAC